MKKFHFVDFAAHFQKGFRNHIVSVSEVPALAQSFGAFGCYATFFFYSDEILTYLSTHAQESGPSVSGYPGKVCAPYFPLDIDHPDLNVARETVRFFLKLFLEKWEINPDGLLVYFSGSKGFHLMLDTRLFGRIVPSKTLPFLFAAMRRHLAQSLPESCRETVDLGIKDRVRLLRLPNTLHEKSGLYKVILTHAEAQALSPDDIRSLAKAVRPLTVTDPTGLISGADIRENPAAAKFFRRIRRQVRQFTRKPFEYHFKRPQDLSHLAFPCAGAQKIWESHVEPGYRNNCAIRLVSELRLLGLKEEEAREKLIEWNEKNAVELPGHELASVVHSAYQHSFPYRYSCRDEILRHFCPLASFEDCQQYVATHTK
ncbi:MAG TPA: primase C-terminal domain-containing protein [bacterium]|nr:primase C-terminal domain-containing protein [bacterium]